VTPGRLAGVRWLHLIRGLGVAVVAAALVACGQAAGTFSPLGACAVDGRAAGAYPQLEALVPHQIGGRPATVDSGRNCSDAALGTLTSDGVHEVRFAGATVDEGQGNGTVVAVFEAAEGQPALTADWIDQFYLAGALQSGKTDNTTTTHPTMGDAGVVFRLDTLNDLSQQTVVVLPDTVRVRVVIVATAVGPDASKAAHDKRVETAVAAAAAMPVPGASVNGRVPESLVVVSAA
jgi:hypothetical protein